VFWYTWTLDTSQSVAMMSNVAARKGAVELTGFAKRGTTGLDECRARRETGLLCAAHTLSRHACTAPNGACPITAAYHNQHQDIQACTKRNEHTKAWYRRWWNGCRRTGMDCNPLRGSWPWGPTISGVAELLRGYLMVLIHEGRSIF
jgi:hypothetical protein